MNTSVGGDSPLIPLPPDAQVADRQTAAILCYLVAVAHMDGRFDVTEQMFVREYIDSIVSAAPGTAMQKARMKTRYHAMYQRLAHYIRNVFAESVAVDDSEQAFVGAKLKLYALEMFDGFEPQEQKKLLAMAEGLMAADGVLHPAEVAFRDQIRALLHDRPSEPAPGPIAPTSLKVTPAITLPFQGTSHPLLDKLERCYPAKRELRTTPSEADRHLANRAISTLMARGNLGQGKLAGVTNVGDISGQPFLDGHVLVQPPRPDKKYELIVLGDLHGCYSCLKGALMQSDFLRKAEAYVRDPENHPNVQLVFLGDYIDRGYFGTEGVLRAALTLYVNLPTQVHLLRGNHEYLVEVDGEIRSGVRPAEDIRQWLGVETKEQFRTYRNLFAHLPSTLIFGRTLFTHGGIPRDETLRKHYQDVSSLNEWAIRYEMMWSDPSSLEVVAPELQAQSARFSFGRRQFRRFMANLGAHTLVRGHQRVNEGFRDTVYEDDLRLLTVFSAGGTKNRDLPDRCDYRLVTPKALTITWEEGEYTVIPWEIDYKTWSHPRRNSFLIQPRKWWWEKP
jgi:hypothetical protein